MIPSAAPLQVISVVEPSNPKGLFGPLISFDKVLLAPFVSVIVIEYEPAVRFVKVYVKLEMFSKD